VGDQNYLALLAFVSLSCGLIGATIASSKGRSAAGFWLGVLLGPIGVIAAAAIEPSTEVRVQREEQLANTFARFAQPDASSRRPCPWCAEPIQPAAIICRFCGREVEPVLPTGARGRWLLAPSDNERLRATYGDIYQSVLEEASRKLNLDGAQPDANVVEAACLRVQMGEPIGDAYFRALSARDNPG
jgi:hypothetical protein